MIDKIGTLMPLMASWEQDNSILTVPQFSRRGSTELMPDEDRIRSPINLPIGNLRTANYSDRVLVSAPHA